jgi:two-component system response regulator
MSHEHVVLLVEDGRDDVDLMKLAFEKNDIRSTLVVATDAREAMEILRSRVPDLVLLDLNLPKMNGLELLRLMRAEAASRLVPVVVLSSSKQESDVRASFELGANSYVRKPVDFEQFVQAIRSIVSYWRDLNERA